jgi:hypothetical protein
MATEGGLNIVTDGLEFYIDSANPKSYTSGSTTEYDLVGTQDLTLNNGVSYSTDNLGSLEFDGIDDYLIADNIYDFNKAGMSFDVWFIRYNNNNSYNIVWQMYVPYLSFRTEGTFLFSRHTKISGVTTQRNLYTTNTFSDNTWYNVVCTNFQDISTGDNIANIYVNGELEVTQIISNSVDEVFYSTVTNRKLMLGAWSVSSPQLHFEGKIPSLKIYNKILSPEEVKQNFNATKKRFGL